MKTQTQLLLLAAMLGTAACQKEAKDTAQAASKPPEPLQVKVATVESRQVARSIAVTGSLSPDETVTVSAEVPGRISALRADFGQTVKKGQVIAELDKQELNIAVERSRAALAQALARVGLDPNQEDLRPESSPAVRQAQAQLDDAKFKFDSAAKLVKSGDISQERYTELEKAYGARKAGYEAATDELRTQLATIRGLKADVALAQKRLNDATVRAPFDGSISEKQVTVGQYIKENTPIFTLVKTYPIRLRLDVPEVATGAVRPGTLLTFTTDAAPGKEFHAIVRELNPSLDPKSRTLTAEARLQDQDPRLKPGIFVQVQVWTDRATNVSVVPKTAVYSVAGLTKVFIVRNGKVAAYQVPPAQEVEGFYEVPSAEIRPGDLVAVNNLGQLVNGQDVRVAR